MTHKASRCRYPAACTDTASWPGVRRGGWAADSGATLGERRHAVEAALRGLVHPAVLTVDVWRLAGAAMRPEKLRRQQRRQRERDESGDEDRCADRHRELVEQPPQDSAHEEDGDEHRGQ